MLAGIAILPAGKRQDLLSEAARHFIDDAFAGRILADAAEAYAAIRARRRRIGRPIEPLDAQIAAITASISATLATRNVSDFDDCGIDVVNPWND